MAMSDKVNNDLILTDPVVQPLIRLSHQCDDTGGKTQPEVFTGLITDTSASESESDLDTDKGSRTDSLDSNTKATAKEFIAEQLSDSSLSTCWALANKNKGSYFVKDGILLHIEIGAKMADKRVVLCNVLCFLASKYGKSDTNTLKMFMIDFYTADLLSVAKVKLSEAVDSMKLSTKRPHRPQRRDASDRLSREVDDLFTLFTFLDEHKCFDQLPTYVSDSPVYCRRSTTFSQASKATIVTAASDCCTASVTTSSTIITIATSARTPTTTTTTTSCPPCSHSLWQSFWCQWDQHRCSQDHA